MHFNKYFILFIVLLAVTACNKKLDDPAPDTSIGAGQVQPKDVPLLVKGTYYRMLGTIYYQAYPIFDFYADDIITVQGGSAASFDPMSYDENTPNPEDSYSNSRYYVGYYSAIGNANFIINYINGKGITNLDRELGESLATRAFCYLKLVEAYGGVVITLEAESDLDKIKRKQNTEAEVYDQIITDLEAAVDILPAFSSSAAFSREAAQVLLARVYLTRGRYTDAKRLAVDAINSPQTDLTPDVASNYLFENAGNTELLFRLVQRRDEQSWLYDMNGLYSVYSPSLPFAGPDGFIGNGRTWVNEELVNSYENFDIRTSLLYKQYAEAVGEEVTFLMKFSGDTLQTSNAFITFPLIRLSEAYLIAAEADARVGSIDLTYYNQLRQARNTTTAGAGDFSDAAEFLEEIEMERRREFVGEGMRWEDMKRFNKAISFLEAKGLPATNVYLPFPTTETARNPQLIQNEGY